MSLRAEKILALAGLQHEGKSSEELIALFSKVLANGMHGLCFSPYIEGQKPGDSITEAQIRLRMAIIKPFTQWIRTFSCTDGNELIPKIAKEFGIKTLVGAWLGKDDAINQKEVANLIKITQEGYVDIAAVGNEVMYRGDLSEEELLQFIHQVKAAVPNTPVGYVDAYYEFEHRPNITEAIDVVLANCYPYWEGCDCDYSLLYMKDMFARATRAAKGKKVIISETGWPSEGAGLHGALPSAGELYALLYQCPEMVGRGGYRALFLFLF